MKNKKGCTSCKPSTEKNSEHTISVLQNYFPFLKNEYRELKGNEIENEEVFKELFPDNDIIDFGLLKAIYQYQEIKKMIK